MKRSAVAALIVLAILTAASAEEKRSKPRVLASFLPVYCFTANVAGDFIRVDTLIPGGLSPHDYQFTPRDARKLQHADLLILNGLGLEPWKERLGRAVASEAVFEAAAGLDDQLIYGGSDHGHGGHEAEGKDTSNPNPHVWLDVHLAMQCVSNITTALSRLDPANQGAYRTNAAAYMVRLKSLDDGIAAGLRPFENSAIFSYHDGLPYFARRYGLKIAAVVQPAPEVNPSPRRLAELRQVAREQHVKALFVEPELRSPLADQISKEFRIPLVRFDLLETGPLTPAAYEDCMRRNLNLVAETLR